jgi:mono/diheme cytochrome c family protein
MARSSRRVPIAALIVVVAAAGLVAAIELRSRRTFDAPLPPLAASADPAVIAAGRYLVYGPATCAYCHVPKDQWKRLDAGEELPLTGDHVFPLPFGRVYSPNLTPDADTGIGRRTDAELARILRYGVRADGRAAFPLMEFHDLSDDDLRSVISYLRARPPYRAPLREHEFSLVGKAVMAFAIVPTGPGQPPAPASPAATVTSVERGAYLANSVASCVGCHTDRNLRDGSFVGPRFAGGMKMDVAADPTKVYVPPNLTPDAATGRSGQWSEDVFVGRFRQGELIDGTPMPWGAYARMTDSDLRSVYRYLRTLPPAPHDTGTAVQAKE